MKLESIIKTCISLFTILLITAFPALGNNKMALNVAEVDFFNDKVDRPTKVRFWYQSAGENCNAKMCLVNSQNPQRIALISHGAFGSPREMNWLGFALASQGYLVAGVAHYGESWVYGPETIDPSTAGRFWQRPQDISFTIDRLSDYGLFNIPLIDNQILMLGHSSGGFTTLAMAGAKLSAGKSQAYCASEQAKNDKGCMYGKQKRTKPMDKTTLDKIGQLQVQMQDKRISAVIALDPALGHTVNEKSLKNVKVPTLVVGSVENDFLPFSTHAQTYAEHIEDAKLVGIQQGAGHFVYTDVCDSNREVNGVSLCKDKQGVDRKLVQKQILNHIFGFIYQNNQI